MSTAKNNKPIWWSELIQPIWTQIPMWCSDMVHVNCPPPTNDIETMHCFYIIIWPHIKTSHFDHPTNTEHGFQCSFAASGKLFVRSHAMETVQCSMWSMNKSTSWQFVPKIQIISYCCYIWNRFKLKWIVIKRFTKNLFNQSKL